MSSYTALTKHPTSGQIKPAFWIDDYFGRHNYGVRFTDSDEVFPADQCEEMRIKTLNTYAEESYEANRQWWLDPETGVRKSRNKGEQLMLIVSEVSEAMEGVRKDLMDDKLPHRKMEEVELADALIRIFDYACGHGLDLEGAYQEKMAYNRTRADHKPENRMKPGGKKF